MHLLTILSLAASVFSYTCSYAMDQKKEIEMQQSRSVSIGVNPDNTILRQTASKEQNVSVAQFHPQPVYTARIENELNKQNCEVRITCCQKVVKCAGFTLVAALVITTGGAAYYLSDLAGTCKDLISPVQQLEDYAAEGIILAREGIALGTHLGSVGINIASLLNQSLSFVQAKEPVLENLINITRNVCSSIFSACQNTEIACLKNPFHG